MRIAGIVLAACVLVSLPTASHARCGLFDAQCKDDERCRAMGAQPGTDIYVQCRLAIQEQRIQGAAAMSRTFMMMQMLNQPAPTYNCTTSYWGGMAHTTCR